MSYARTESRSIQLREIEACPQCGSTRRTRHSYALPNLYSEKLAGLCGLSELDLIERMPNVACGVCNLVYKRRWFPELLLRRLFTEAVPDHPRGWDAISDRFRPNNFLAELDLYEKAVAAGDQPAVARWRRALLSIIDSIGQLQDRPERAEIEQALENGDFGRVREHAHLICSSMNRPVAFKRFAGFCSETMWEWCEEHAGRIDAYAELGCPLWGMLPIARKRGRHVAFLSRAEPNYWSDACRSDGQTCIERLRARHSVESRDWRKVNSAEYSMIGAFQYLDHLEKPLEFMKELFTKARACALILDHFSQPTALQHFTGWTPEAIKCLAGRFGKRIEDGFEPIKASGNRLYLLC